MMQHASETIKPMINSLSANASGRNSPSSVNRSCSRSSTATENEGGVGVHGRSSSLLQHGSRQEHSLSATKRSACNRTLQSATSLPSGSVNQREDHSAMLVHNTRSSSRQSKVAGHSLTSCRQQQHGGQTNNRAPRKLHRLQVAPRQPSQDRSNSSNDEVDPEDIACSDSNTPRLPNSAFQASKRYSKGNSPFNNTSLGLIQVSDSIQREQHEVSLRGAEKTCSLEIEMTPSTDTVSKGGTEASFTCSRNRHFVATRSSSLDRQQLGDTAKKNQNFFKSEKGPPVCVCSAAAYYERERVNTEKKKALLKEESEAIRKEIILHRQQKQHLNELYVNVQTAEECAKAKQEALKAREVAVREDEAKVEQRENQVKQERKEVEQLRSDLLLEEKDLEIRKKRLEREHNDLRMQAEIQKKECSRLSALETQLRRKEAELEDEEKRLNELQEVLEEQRQEQIAEKRVLEKQKSALGDAELEVEETKAKLGRWAEDLRLREDSLEQQATELESLKLVGENRAFLKVNEKHDQALKTKSSQLDTDYEQLRTEQRELEVRQETFSQEVERWKSEVEVKESELKEEYKEKMQKLDERAEDVERREKRMSLKETTLEEFEAELDERANCLQISERQLAEKRVAEALKEKKNAEVETELKNMSESLELERHKLVKRREEIEKLVMEHEAIKEELLREKEHLKQQLHEEADAERCKGQLQKKKESLELRESVLKSQEKRSEWYQSVMQDIVDQKEHLELATQAFELEKQSFNEMREAIEEQHESMNKTIKAREETLARLDLSIQQRIRDVHRQETLLDNRLAEESSSLKHKLLTVSRPSDNPVIRQTDRLYQTSSPLGSAARQRMPLLSLNEIGGSNSHRVGLSTTMPASTRATRPVTATAALKSLAPTARISHLSVEEYSNQHEQLTGRTTSKAASDIDVRKKRKASRQRSSRPFPCSIGHGANENALFRDNEADTYHKTVTCVEDVEHCKESPSGARWMEESPEKKRSVKCLSPCFDRNRSQVKRDGVWNGGAGSTAEELLGGKQRCSVLSDDIDDALATPREFTISLSELRSIKSKHSYLLKQTETSPPLSGKFIKCNFEIPHDSFNHQQVDLFSCSEKEEKENSSNSEYQSNMIGEGNALPLGAQIEKIGNEGERETIGLLGRICSESVEESKCAASEQQQVAPNHQELQGSVNCKSSERSKMFKDNLDEADLKKYFHSSKDKFVSLMSDKNVRNECYDEGYEENTLLNNSLLDGLDSPLLL